MPRNPALTVAITCVAALSLCLPAHAKKKARFTAVTSPVEDKAGADAATELDFRRLTAETDEAGVTLTIETWTAWGAIDGPEESQISIVVARPNHKQVYGSAFKLNLVGDGLALLQGPIYGGRVDERSEGKWAPTAGSWEASIDGTTITVRIPWEQFPEEEPWIQVWAMHVKDHADEETGETVRRYEVGRSVGVPNDEVPNTGKALPLVRP